MATLDGTRNDSSTAQYGLPPRVPQDQPPPPDVIPVEDPDPESPPDEPPPDVREPPQTPPGEPPEWAT